MICPKCNKENLEGAHFCESCGAPLRQHNDDAATKVGNSNPFNESQSIDNSYSEALENAQSAQALASQVGAPSSGVMHAPETAAVSQPSQTNPQSSAPAQPPVAPAAAPVPHAAMHQAQQNYADPRY